MRFIGWDGLRERGITQSRATIYRLIAAGKFPRPVKVSPGRNGWPDYEIDQYQEQRIAERDADPAA
jgi:prophage regulatory protein